MRLISVQAILDIEQGNNNPGVKILKQFSDDELAETGYGILSHCWGKETEEVKLKEMEDLLKWDEKARDHVRERSGYWKIVKTCEQARSDGLEWVWVDTCCIDKVSSAELSEAINSMYRWYENATQCYAFLHDVEEKALPTVPNGTFRSTNGWPKWFSRGWTLQELIAPSEVHFFNAKWQQLENGTRTRLAPTLSRITGIPVPILRYGLDADQPSAAQIMSWAARRQTTRVEDRAYSLMGLFGVYMPMLYGEGRNAFWRLQLEIIRMTNDHSIFAWKDSCPTSSVLADDPVAFEYCGNVIKMEPEEYRRLIEQDISEGVIPEDRFRTCSVTNAGIQIWLPITQYGDSNTFEATLACRDGDQPVHIQLAYVKSKYHRFNGPTGERSPLQLQLLFLAYNEKTYRDHPVFKINDSIVSGEGFVLEDKNPDGITSTDNISVPHNECAEVSYFNQRIDIGFAVALGLFAGQAWAHLANLQPEAFENHAKRVRSGTLGGGPKHAEAIAKTGKTGKTYCHIKHLHLRRSISDVRLTLQRLPQRNSYLITLDIVQCAGCCMSNDRWESLDTVPVGEGCILGNVRRVLDKELEPRGTLLVDGIPTVFARTGTKTGLELGDYGQWDEVTKYFEREGNIFQQPTSTAFVPDLCPVRHEILSPRNILNRVDRVNFGVVPKLVLRYPLCLSLPDDERIRELLKGLSTPLKGKCLATTVIRCPQVPPDSSVPLNSWPDHVDSEDNFPISIPLFIPTQPLLWYREGACQETRAYFQEVRKHFGILSNAWDHRPTEMQAAVNFLSNMFGGKWSRCYTGEIEFFRKIPTVRSDQLKGSSLVESDKGIQLQPSEMPDEQGCRQVGVTGQGSRLEFLARNLAQQMPLKTDGSVEEALSWQPYHYAETVAQKIRSSTFGPEVLQIIATAYQRPWKLQHKSESNEDEKLNTPFGEHGKGCGNDKDIKDDGFVDQHKIKLLLRHVETLQTELDACQDEDEQCALEEDLTGKMLLACWYGVRAEFEQVLIKVVDCAVYDKDVDCSLRLTRIKFLNSMGDAFHFAADNPGLDDPHQLRRITADAQANISKHALLLSARQQAKVVPSSKDLAKVTTTSPMSGTEAIFSVNASTDAAFIIDGSTSRVGMKRGREEEIDACEVGRPLSRLRRDDYKSESEAPNS